MFWRFQQLFVATGSIRCGNFNCFRDDCLQNAPDDLPEDSFVPAGEVVAVTIPCSEEPDGLPNDAAVVGIAAEDGSQLDAEHRQGGVGAFKIDGLPELIRFVNSEDGGVEAVPAGVAVAGLAAALSFIYAYRCHIEHVRTYVLMCQEDGDGGLVCG